MAMLNADGSIILSTKVDTGEVDKLGKIYEKALKKGDTQLASLVQNFKKATKEVENQKKVVQELKQELDDLSSGTVDIKTPETEKIRKEIDAVTKNIEEQEKQIEQYYERMNAIQSDAFIDPRTKEPILVGKDKEEFQKINIALDELEPKLEENRAKAEELKKSFADAMGTATQDKIDATKQKLGDAELKLDDLSAKADISGAKLSAATSKITKGFSKLTKRVATLIKRVFIFGIILKTLRAVADVFKNILMSDEEFRQDWEELKAAFYTAAYPIIKILVPAIKFIVQQVRDWAISIGQVAASLQGMSYSELVEQAEASKEAADNYESMAKDSKKTAKNVERQLAAFDDIQILSSPKSNEENLGFASLKEYDTSKEQSTLLALMSTIGGALAAVGLILLLKGRIAWGIGFLVAGAAFWGISEIWGEDYDPNSATDVLSNIMQTISISLVAIGIILITKGILTWGFGFLIAGASIWAINEIATGEFSTDPVVDTLIKIMGIAGVSLLAIGLIMMVFGQVTPLSLGIMIAGAASLAGAVALNTEAIVEAIRGPLGVIMAIVGAALLVIGIILVCTGGGIPLGIALIAAGAVSLVTPIALNANAIVDWVKGVWEAVKGFWNKYIAPVFTAKFWLDVGKGALNGLIWAFELALNVITLGLRTLVNGAIELLNTLGGVIGLDWDIPTIPEISLPRLAQGTVVPPNKEFMAILGDNTKEHEIVSPISTMKQAFMEAMVEMGGAGQTTKEEHYYLDENEVMRIIYKLAKQGEQSRGEDLLESW